MVNEKVVYVLGAGMSGLVVAYEYAKRGLKVKVIERLQVPGGLARTMRFDGYYIDAGPHLFHTSNPDIIAYWGELFSDVFKTPTLYGKNYVDGLFFDYPLTEETLKQLNVDLYETIKSELGAVDKKKLTEARNYKEYMTQLAGPTLQKLFYDEYPEKLWGIPVTQLSANWAPQRIEIRKEKKPFHSSQWSAVAKNGCGETMEILAKKVTDFGGEIFYNESITGLGLNGGRIDRINTTEKIIPVFDSDIVISTLPVTTNAGFFQIPCSLSYRNVKLVVVITTGKDPFPADADWLYFKDKEVIFHRAGLQTRFSREGIPEGWSIICCEIAYSIGDSVSKMADDELTNRVISDLEKLGFIEQHEIVRSHSIDLGAVYPGYKVGYEAELQNIRSELEKVDNFYCTGTLADFSYADFQILCAKAIDLVNAIEDKGSAFNHIQRVTHKVKKFNDVIMIGESAIGEQYSPYIIGEIGLCHNGSVELAKQLIDVCANAGCNAVKLQTFNSERISSKVLDARYTEDILDLEENFHQLFNRLIFSYEELYEIFSYAKLRKIDIFSTPFDVESVGVLERLNVPAYKISSMDIVNLPLIKAVALTMKPIIISTGMCTLGDIEDAVNTVMEAGNPNLILLHCVSSYPASIIDTNLKMIPKLKDIFQTVIGFSDHFPEIYLVPSAIALGARVIEKHVTIDRSMKGPDHIFSLEPHAVKALVEQAGATFLAIGSGTKAITASEYRTAQRFRRTLFAKINISEGEVITRDMLIIKSPGMGILPKYMDLVIGRKARANIEADYPITWEAI